MSYFEKSRPNSKTTPNSLPFNTIPTQTPLSILYTFRSVPVKIAFTNTWRNLLIADCARPVQERLSTSGLHYFQGGRKTVEGRGLVPTIYSGYTSLDALQPNGVLGPVVLKTLAH